MLGTSIMGNLTGTSILTQYNHEAPIVWAIVASVAGLTALKGVTDVQVKSESLPGRASMVTMTALILLEVAFNII
jgi:hypothetical protein